MMEIVKIAPPELDSKENEAILLHATTNTPILKPVIMSIEQVLRMVTVIPKHHIHEAYFHHLSEMCNEFIPVLCGMKENELGSVNLKEIQHLMAEISTFLARCNQIGMIQNALLSSLIKSEYEEGTKRLEEMKMQLLRVGVRSESDLTALAVPEEKRLNTFQIEDQLGRLI